MKSLSRLLLCSLLATAALTSTLRADDELVTNKNFETATTDATWPDGWGKGPGTTWEAEGGKHFLRLTQAEPGKMLMAYREVAIPAGTKKITITISYRTNGIVPGAQKWFDARAIFHYTKDDKTQVKPEPKPIIFSKTAADWTTVTEECAVPEGATKLVLMPSLFQVQAGTLDLAEVSVVKS